jgi:hypothetical protein
MKVRAKNVRREEKRMGGRNMPWWGVNDDGFENGSSSEINEVFMCGFSRGRFLPPIFFF